MNNPDAVVVGSGPNGLAAAITLAQAGVSVLVLEAAPTIGGGLRSAEKTLPGFVHDVCSAIHPLGYGSPFFRMLPLEKHGLDWVHPNAPLAHPFDDGTAALLERSIEATTATLDKVDRDAYTKLMQPISDAWGSLSKILLAPPNVLRHPIALPRFGIHALRPIRALVESRFHRDRARALLAGMSGHAMLPIEKWGSAAIGLVLGACGHHAGWPFPRGGAQTFANALASYLVSLGGKIETNVRVDSLAGLPTCRAVLFDVGVRELLRIAGSRFSVRYRRLLSQYRYAMGAYKVDWALSAPVPWKAPEVARAGTVHLAGTMDEISSSEQDAWLGRHSARPLVLLAQHTLFDKSRSPEGKHTLWGYCHVPLGSNFSMLERIEAQIERFAPGFRDVVLARSAMTPHGFEDYNPNISGGDINGGAQDLWQVFIRPTLNHYVTSAPDLFLCSSSTPPGGGVHGMCGHLAATVALRRRFQT